MLNYIPSRNCGTNITPEQVKAAEAHFLANKVTSFTAQVVTPIDIIFHVIQSGTTLATGNVP